ncbi:hypothetical protein Y88_2706 [Novosphingobium nitrogenifigens DSM 19370]|uniref:Permease n=1 Tax=Novosphingobium nitrogenifigens DSM 19370 TaxID=983920 RepID=F1Z7A9_9SPHN|nr:AI-2E family transporter [Novosphingobium nitrogenifigens]EGD59528.1 hypothetical protein Y88_2706 [Novosphingobium nitrogenifigens DSM 19370]
MKSAATIEVNFQKGITLAQDNGDKDDTAIATIPPRAFQIGLVAAATVGFLWLIAPFSGAILWAVIVTILFSPLNAALLRGLPGRRNTAALIALLVIVAVLVVPAILLGKALVEELGELLSHAGMAGFDPGRAIATVQSFLPEWAHRWLSDLGLGDLGLADPETLRQRITRGLAGGLQAIAPQILNVGQGALGLFLTLGVMLYLTFFLLRDGRGIAERIERALPLPALQRRRLLSEFVSVVRATVKGSMTIAVVQGGIGGFTFWMLGLPGALLWGLAMGVFSLFPAVGTGFIWVPASIYLLATGAVWKGVILFLCGFFVISTIDNVIRPILVGRDTQMPDYIVLISTLGGFNLFGFNGFVLGPVIAALFLSVWDIFGRGVQDEAENS